MTDGMAAGEDILPAVLVIDTEGTVLGWTPAAETLTGYRAEDILGRSGLPMLVPTDRDAWARRLRYGSRWSGLFELVRRDGTTVLLRVRAARVQTSWAGDAWVVVAITAADDLSGGTGSLLESLISRFPVAMAIWDRDLRVVWLNAEAERLRTVFPHYEVGRSLAEPIKGVDTRAAAEAMRNVLDSGEPAIDREARWVAVDQSDERTLSTSLFRLQGVAGQALGVVSLALDITHSKARDRLELLREASIRIGTTLDIKKTAQELADLAVPAMADFCTVDLAESVLPGTEPLQRLATTSSSIPVFRRAAIASVHREDSVSLWKRGQAVYVSPSSPFTKVLASGEPHFEAVMEDEPGGWLDEDPERAKVIRETGMHSMIIVPLQARGELLGVAVFLRYSNKQSFTRDDVILAEELGVRAALSLDNARQYTRERNAALALQRNLLPRNLSGGGALEVASRYLPSDLHEGVGGDWFDAIPLSDSRVALVVGDVTGHGINAAATMGRLRTAVRTLAYLGLPPAELLTSLDELVERLAEEDGGTDGQPFDATGATCLYVVYDPATQRCTMAAAGHPPPAIVSASCEVSFPKLPSGTPIGLGLGSFESLDLDFPAGSMIALYTDGLIETRQDDLDAGMERLRVALTQGTLPLNELCSSVIRTIVGDTPPDDDVALLMARVPPSGRGHKFFG